MSVLAQARIEANDAASAPPLIMVKREQLVDILAHLEPFGEAIQVRGTLNVPWYTKGLNDAYVSPVLFLISPLGPTRKWGDCLLHHTVPSWAR